MDTTTGRFTSMDSYLGSVDDPVSLHKYLYVNANPVNYIDPSGYEGTLAESEVVLYGMLTIASIMTFPAIDLSLLRNNNISIDYVNESVDLSKTVIWGIFEGTFSIANANEQFINFVVHMAKSDKEQKKEKEKEKEKEEKSDEEEDYYKNGLKEIPDDWIEVDAPEELKIKSESFKNFLKRIGENPKKWKKVVEKWASPEGKIYQRNYWTNGKDYYYHGNGIEEFFPH